MPPPPMPRASAISAARSSSTELRSGCQRPRRRAAATLGDDARGGGVFAHQERAHPLVADIGVVDRLDERAGNGVGGLGKTDQPVDRFGEFRRAARPVPHLALDEARIGGARPDDAANRFRDRARPRARRVGRVEHDDVGIAAEGGDRGGKAADEGDIGRAFENVAARVVAGVDEQVGLGYAAGECARRGLALAVGAAIGVGSRLQIGPADLLARPPVAARQKVLDPGAIGAGGGAEDAGRGLAAFARPAASGLSEASSSRAATAAAAASISAICVGNMSRNRPEMRQVTSTRGRPTVAIGSTSMPVTRPVAASHCGRQPISASPWAISSPPVRRLALPHRSITSERGQSP